MTHFEARPRSKFELYSSSALEIKAMVGWLLKATFSVILVGVLSYVVVAVPIGRRPLLEHVVRIAQTKPAKELAEDVGSATSSAVDRARTALK
jgi:hypothetical protein